MRSDSDGMEEEEVEEEQGDKKEFTVPRPPPVPILPLVSTAHGGTGYCVLLTVIFMVPKMSNLNDMTSICAKFVTGEMF